MSFAAAASPTDIRLSIKKDLTFSCRFPATDGPVAHKIKATGVDLNPSVIDAINHGRIHIVEPPLDGLVHYVVKQGYLKTGTKPVQSDVYLIAVHTPFKENHAPDLAYVESAIRITVRHK